MKSRPRDIEDLVTLGRELKTCPYYGSRKAVNRAEVCLTLPSPYRSLKQAGIRISPYLLTVRLVDSDATV